MSEMTRNTPSDDTLIHDSQLSGFSAFKERLAYCCCRLSKKSSNYNLTSITKDMENQADKPSYINQAYQAEKKERKDKLEKIAKTLPGATFKGTQRIPTPNSIGQTPTRTLTTITQGTPRSATISTPTRPPTSATITRTGISTLNKPSPLSLNTKTNNKLSDKTTTDDSTEEESSSSDDKSSDSDSVHPTRVPNKHTNKRR